MAKQKPTKTLAVLGRCRRTGRWRVGARSSVLTVLGDCRLDMRASFVDEEATALKMSVTVLLGSAVIILPEGAEVRPSGMSLLSVSLVDVPRNPEPSTLPTLEIEWNCVLGRLYVLTGSALEQVAQARAEARANRRLPWRRRRVQPVARTVASPQPAADDDLLPGPPVAKPTWLGAGATPETPVAEPPAEALTVPDVAAEAVPDVAAAAEVVEPTEVVAPIEVVVEADPAADTEPEERPEPAAVELTAEGEPMVAEAWRTHDWGDAPVDEPAAEAQAEADDQGSAIVDEPGVEPVAEAWRTHDWGDAPTDDTETAEAAADAVGA